MAKILFLGSLLAATMVIFVAQAQNMAPNTPESPSGGSLLRGQNITSTGQSVPHPGVSLGAGQTELDRRIQRRDEMEQRSICSNC